MFRFPTPKYTEVAPAFTAAVRDSKDPAGAIISTEEALPTNTPVNTDPPFLNTDYYNAVPSCGKNKNHITSAFLLKPGTSTTPELIS
jgi:hypothetical protein